LQKVLKPFGKPFIDSAAFVCPLKGCLPHASIMEKIGQTCFPWFGQLLIGKVKK